MKNVDKPPVHIAHLTSVHKRYDVRIFRKMCRSLAVAGYRVSLIVADGIGDEIVDNVFIIDAGAKSINRLMRMILSAASVFRCAVRSGASVCHIHDPELIFFGVLLRIMGRKVIYDAHEDLPRQLLSKPYLKRSAAVPLSLVLEVVENICVKVFNSVITATENIGTRFRAINKKTVVINNFPSLNELVIPDNAEKKQSYACYVGGLSGIRGATEIAAVSDLTLCPIEIAGSFDRVSLEKEVVDNHPGIVFRGMIERDKLGEFISGSICGLVPFHPVPNHINALPTKLFEYMAAGIPVVVSDFPLWKSIVKEGDCGKCIDPFNAEQIAEAVNFFVNNPDEAERMGTNGNNLVMQKYNWSIEEKKLIALYDTLTENKN